MVEKMGGKGCLKYGNENLGETEEKIAANDNQSMVGACSSLIGKL